MSIYQMKLQEAQESNTAYQGNVVKKGRPVVKLVLVLDVCNESWYLRG